MPYLGPFGILYVQASCRINSVNLKRVLFKSNTTYSRHQTRLTGTPAPGFWPKHRVLIGQLKIYAGSMF